MKQTVGIIGGMGPLAACDLFRKLVEVEEAATDQEHLRVCIDSNTEIPDRTEAILRGGDDPLPQLVKSAVLLESMGANVLIMGCNTAHFYYDAILPHISVPFLNMLDESARAAAEAGIRTVGLLATDGTIESGVYERSFTAHGLDMEVPSPRLQRELMRLIYDEVKAGAAHPSLEHLLAAVEELRARGAETMVLGCTELPLVCDACDFPRLDPTLLLACRAVEFAGGRVKLGVWENIRNVMVRGR